MSIPTLTTDRLLLRPYRDDDADAVQRLAGAEEVARGTLTIPHPYPDGMAAHWIATHEELWSGTEALILAMDSPDDGLVGSIGLMFEMDHNRAELGYWVGVPHWGRGYATEAGRGLLAYGFEHLKLRRVYAQHFAWNVGSGRVLQKLGMRHEGTLRAHHERFGQQDSHLYGILASEWTPGTNG
ncbi:MAG: GNAT family N-acetyltransferase [Gemmatimonadota bacterium]|nr:GNAT family N-acetyltransferase [Gemmatimonadota bacterium]